MEMEAKEKSKAAKSNNYTNGSKQAGYNNSDVVVVADKSKKNISGNQSENSEVEQTRQNVQRGAAPQKSPNLIIPRFTDSQVSITNLSPNVKKPSSKNLALPIENSHPKNRDRRMSVAPV